MPVDSSAAAISLLLDRGVLDRKKWSFVSSAGDDGEKNDESGSGARRGLSPTDSRPRKRMVHRCENSRLRVGDKVTDQILKSEQERSGRLPER